MSLAFEGVEGLTRLESPAGHVRVNTKFALPPNFDSKKFASKWVKQGNAVNEAQQPTVFVEENLVAQGWQVFKVLDTTPILVETKKGEEKQSPKMIPYTRIIGSEVFVLLFRPLPLQRAINVIYANRSRKIVDYELKGETAAVNEAGDPGILTSADLAKFRGRFDEEQVENPLKSQQVPDTSIQLA